MTTTDNRYNPASASSYQYIQSAELKSFVDEFFNGIVTGTDEWLLKHDALDKASEWSTEELLAHFMKVSWSTPQNAYRERLAMLGFWPKNSGKPVNAKACAERGGEYLRRANKYECIRKAADKVKKSLLESVADEAIASLDFAVPLTSLPVLKEAIVKAGKDGSKKAVTQENFTKAAKDAALIACSNESARIQAQIAEQAKAEEELFKVELDALEEGEMDNGLVDEESEAYGDEEDVDVSIQTVPVVNVGSQIESMLAIARALVNELSNDKKATKAEILAAFAETVDMFSLVK